MEVLKRYHNHMKGLPTGWFILLMVLLTFVALLPFQPLYVLLERVSGPMKEPEGILALPFPVLIFVVSVIAPIFETATGQWAPIKLLRHIFKWSSPKLVLASATA